MQITVVVFGSVWVHLQTACKQLCYCHKMMNAGFGDGSLTFIMRRDMV
jgi:hypothetical protein